MEGGEVKHEVKTPESNRGFQPDYAKTEAADRVAEIAKGGKAGAETSDAQHDDSEIPLPPEIVAKIKNNPVDGLNEMIEGQSKLTPYQQQVAEQQALEQLE
jgi:hypothetical protein